MFLGRLGTPKTSKKTENKQRLRRQAQNLPGITEFMTVLTRKSLLPGIPHPATDFEKHQPLQPKLI